MVAAAVDNRVLPHDHVHLMPIYVFESPEGSTLEEYFPAHDAPKIGTTITREGKEWTRVPAVGSVMGRREVHFTSQQIRPYHPMAPRHDAEGLAQFHSRKEVAEFEAATATEEGYKHDEL